MTLTFDLDLLLRSPAIYLSQLTQVHFLQKLKKIFFIVEYLSNNEEKQNGSQ